MAAGRPAVRSAGGTKETDGRAGHLSIIAFSGTVDRLYPVAILASGAVANDLRVDIFLTFWGLLAARRDPGPFAAAVSRDYGDQGEAFLQVAQQANLPGWKALLGQAKELGDVHVWACAMTMDLLKVRREDLDPMVEGVVGAGEFVDMAKDGTTLVF
jgi:peroxiredoxin family protein